MVYVKVCGITNLDDALASVDAGAHALGFNFYRASPRYIEPADAAQIIQQLPNSVLTVGVFVNEPGSESIERLAGEAGVQAVQLHGDESSLFCHQLRDLFVIKALRVNDDFEPEQVGQFQTDAILLDGYSGRAYGGTGQSFNWAVAARTRPLVKKLFLAGGLNATNVGQAIETVKPYAVDVCSALETVPGRKDLAKLAAFMDATRKAAGNK